MNHDIYQILENLDAAQKSVKQLPALFKPKDTSPQLSGPYPGVNATRGYLVGEADEDDLEAKERERLLTAFKKKQLPQQNFNLVQRVTYDQLKSNPMAQAVIRRIANAHPEWLMKYGPEAVMQAVEDVTEGDTDWEEIGSSDVSAYVQMVGDRLRDRQGGREEMDDRKPFAEEIDTGEYDARKTVPSDEKGDKAVFSRHRDRMEKLKKDQDENTDVKESQDNTVYQVSRAMLDNNPGRSYLKATEDEILADAAKELARMGMSDIRVRAIMRDPDFAGELIDTLRGPITESATTEDVLSTVKKKLGDYLQDVATAIKKDPDLMDKLPQTQDDIKAVKTIKTADGHEIKITGNEDDGFRVSIRNKNSSTKFANLDEAVMAVEMYCARRRQAVESADYIEEKR
jgi:hypothetical protein